MESRTVAIVPSQQGNMIVTDSKGTRTIKKGKAGKDERLEYLEQLSSSTILGVMGGPAQNLFVRASQLGHTVCRVPWFKLAEIEDLTRGMSAEDRALALVNAWSRDAEAFYVMSEFDEQMFRLRELTRVRLTIQQDYRIKAKQQYDAAFRDLEPLLPEGKEFATIRTMFAKPQLIAGAEADEKALETQIKSLVKGLDIWEWLHPGDDSVLPIVKGLGPSLGGSIVAEIGDIRRFPAAANLRAYARYHVALDGGMPRRKKGAVSAWNRYLERAVWVWSTDQARRYRDHIWRSLYEWKWADEIRRHPEPIPEEMKRQDGEAVTVTRYSLGHLESRAQRWLGSQLLEYVYGLWTAGNNGDPEQWYKHSHWPGLFDRIRSELDDGLRDWLDEERDKRRKVPVKA